MTDKKKPDWDSYWDRLATKDDVFNGAIVMVVVTILGLFIGASIGYAF